MIGVLLQAVATFFEEISGSLGKWMVERKEESFYALGFQNTMLSLSFFVVYAALDTSRWHLDPRSYPTLALLCLSNVAQGWATLKSMAIAERSTFNFIRVGTMPLLLIVDLFIGTQVSNRQIAGVIIIAVALVALFVNHGIDRKGFWLVGFTAVNSVANIAIYKWHITVYNSVAAEQAVLHLALVLFFLWGARRISRENPLRLMARPHAVAQSAAYASGSVIESFAYLYGPASIVLTAKRSFAVLWSIAAGNKIFHEKALALRVSVCAAIIAGLVLIIR